MSFTYGFYNSVNHDRVYDAQQWSSIFDGLIADGVYETQGQKFMVTASDPASMVVTVGTGRAWFYHTWSLNDSPLPVTIEASDLVVPRIDIICLEVNSDNNTRANSIKVVKGLPDANPVPPDLINTEFVHQIPLAQITIAAGTTSISQSAITNKVGTSACPFVVGIIEMMDVDPLIAQWQQQWTEYFADIQEDYADWVEEFEAWYAGWKNAQTDDFEAWFDHMKDQLSEDAAGHLQMEIDDINNVTIPDLDKSKQNNEAFVSHTILASGWSNNVYSFETLYPSANYDIVGIYPNSQTTADMRDAWDSADCGGYEPTNVIRAHGDVPTIDIVMTLVVRYKTPNAVIPPVSP